MSVVLGLSCQRLLTTLLWICGLWTCGVIGVVKRDLTIHEEKICCL